MDVRPADESDAAAIGRVFRRSLEGSYALSPQVIDDLVEAYSGDDLADRLSEEGVYLVAEADGRVVGFAEGRMAGDGVGELVWLHVAPAGRGEGAGTGLFERTREEFGARGADHVRARVLADNREGEAFLERFGLRELAETPVEYAGVEFTAHVYADDEAAVAADTATPVAGDDGGEDPSPVPDEVTDEGRTVYLSGDEPIPGSEAPFFRTFRDEGRREHYGYYCTNCGSTATAMGELERIECSNCGNVHRADEWDAAYL